MNLYYYYCFKYLSLCGRIVREGNGNLLQYSCLENPMERVAWWATAHVVEKVGHDQQLNHQSPPGGLCCCYCSVSKQCLTLCNPMDCRARLPVPISWSLSKFMSIEQVMLSDHLILWHSFLILPSILPSTGSFPTSRLFTSVGQSIGALASAPVLLLCKKLLSIIRHYLFIFVFISVTLGDRFP